MLKASLSAALFVLLSTPALSDEPVLGPVQCEVVRVVDGDTFVADCLIWPSLNVTIGVRLRSVDTPEIRGDCSKEKIDALAAKEFTKDFLSNGPIYIRNITHGKYAERVVADVFVDKRSLGDALLSAKLARLYDGGKRKSWCEE